MTQGMSVTVPKVPTCDADIPSRSLSVSVSD
jgi:hypothetical protein